MVRFEDLACKPLYATRPTPGRKNLLPAAENIAKELGWPLMEWQKYVIAVATELDPATGKFAYGQVICTVPRQNGKSTLLLVLILLRALMQPKQEIAYAAQSYKEATKKLFDEWLPELQASKFKKLISSRTGNGKERIFFNKTRSYVIPIASTEKAGHGGHVDLAIVDEAFSYQDARLEQSLGPSQLTKAQPQFWIISTAGSTDGKSAWLEQKVNQGRVIAKAGYNENTAYFEWAAAEDLDPGDPATWRSCMPALGVTITEKAVAGFFESMPLAEFERAFLNRWTVAQTEPVFPLKLWQSLEDDTFSLFEGPISLAYDINPSRSHGAIAAAGKLKNGHYGIQVIDYDEDTDWIIPRLEELCERYNVRTVYYADGSPAVSLASRLRGKGTLVTAKDHASACGQFFDLAQANALHHKNETVLTDAFVGAQRRHNGDAWLWNRRDSTVDICPLVACTLALYGAQKATGATQLWSLNDLVAQIESAKEPEPATETPAYYLTPLI